MIQVNNNNRTCGRSVPLEIKPPVLSTRQDWRTGPTPCNIVFYPPLFLISLLADGKQRVCVQWACPPPALCSSRYFAGFPVQQVPGWRPFVPLSSTSPIIEVKGYLANRALLCKQVDMHPLGERLICKVMFSSWLLQCKRGIFGHYSLTSREFFSQQHHKGM